MKDFWTEKEVATLRRLWPRLSGGEIAKKLGKTRNAVIGKQTRLGLLGGPAYPKWTRAEIRELEKLWPRLDIPTTEIARRLHRTYSALRKRAVLFGIRRRAARP